MGFAAISLIAWGIWWMFFALTRSNNRRLDRAIRCLCPACGYDLAGNVSCVCPECGTSRGGPVL